MLLLLLAPRPCKNENVIAGSWIAGQSAGGCRNYLDTFAMNPQYRVTITDPDEDDDDNLCTAIVSLMQKGRRALRDEGLDTLTIGENCPDSCCSDCPQN